MNGVSALSFAIDRGSHICAFYTTIVTADDFPIVSLVPYGDSNFSGNQLIFMLRCFTHTRREHSENSLSDYISHAYRESLRLRKNSQYTRSSDAIGRRASLSHGWPEFENFDTSKFDLSMSGS